MDNYKKRQREDALLTNEKNTAATNDDITQNYSTNSFNINLNSISSVQSLPPPPAPITEPIPASRAHMKEDISANQYHCDYCRSDITTTTYIRCAECQDFDLCLECFAHGVEVFQHRNNHKYRVIDHITQVLYEEEWGAHEEILLLDALEQYGFGNWADISEHLKTKSKNKCEAHYTKVYLQSSTAPLPDPNVNILSKQTYGETSDINDIESNKDTKKNKDTNKSKKDKVTNKPYGYGNVVGYQPFRQDFETEYENDAELVICDMEILPEDTPAERQLKLKVLEIYNRKLQLRAERKKFILERGLLFPKPPRKDLTKEEKDIVNSLRVFARFLSQQDHEQFVDGILREYRLRRRIEQLQNYRLQGYTNLEDAEREFNNVNNNKNVKNGNKKQEQMNDENTI